MLVKLQRRESPGEVRAHHSTFGVATQDQFFLSPVTSHEIWTFIGKMDASKSSGPYSVPVTILKTIRDHICEPLAFLVNNSFASGNFPEKLKLARITPVFKKGSRFDKNNYRPISVLSNFSKLFEKAMYHRLYSYLEELKILYPLQFGFREKFSTTHALIISITESIRQSIDNNEFGYGIFIDLKKAFETVNRAILLTKLNPYGIRLVVHGWLKSYLSQGEQFVNVNGHNSLKFLASRLWCSTRLYSRTPFILIICK